MAFDEGLAQRIRRALAEEPGVSEKRMFGGIAFLINGNMAVGVVRDDLMVRVGPERYDRLLNEANAREMDFTGKPMAGYVYIDEPGTATEEALRFWVKRSIGFVATLPPKPKK